ncbi:MAG: hypothetical protein ACREL3_08700 [Gemmatimonadales bacterium]
MRYLNGKSVATLVAVMGTLGLTTRAAGNTAGMMAIADTLQRLRMAGAVVVDAVGRVRVVWPDSVEAERARGTSSTATGGWPSGRLSAGYRSGSPRQRWRP